MPDFSGLPLVIESSDLLGQLDEIGDVAVAGRTFLSWLGQHSGFIQYIRGVKYCR